MNPEVDTTLVPDTPAPATPAPSVPNAEMHERGAEASAHDRHSHADLVQGNELLSRVVQSAHEAIDRLAESAAPHVVRLQQGTTDASAKLREHADRAKRTGDEWTDELRVAVRSRPLTAVATAFAVGALLARLTR